MKCENHFCIYQTEDKCILGEVNIDSIGMYAECIYPDIDKEILEQEKLKLLKAFEKDDN